MRLTVHEPGGAERRVEIGAGAFFVGRDGDCDIVLADEKASRRHAVIEGGPSGAFTLRDLSSTNGTSVDGRTIAATVDLHDGERITIGGTTLTVDDVDPQRLVPAGERATVVQREPASGSAPPTDQARESQLEPVSLAPSPPAPATHPPPPETASPPHRPGARLARPWSRRRILVTSAGAALALLVLVLLVAQLVLPGIAASRLRDSLARHGTVQSVSVDAFPAVTLLWHHADKVTVRMSTYGGASTGATAVSAQPADTQPRSGRQRLADFLASTSATDSLDARVGQLKVGRLALSSVVVTKHGSEIAASAYASYGDIRAALPSYLSIRSFAAGGGELLFTGAATLLGSHASVRMRLLAHNGALVVQPDLGSFLPSVLSLTVFKDPRVIVESVAAAPAPGGFDISARARLTGG